jgi:DNA-binding MarR family transcriptional regulator
VEVICVTREAALEDLYQALGTLVRRSRDLGSDLHPGLSVVAYTLLVQVEAEPHARAADLAAHFGLDKSTVSRQLDQLVAAGLLRREGERPGRRGQCLALTDAGRAELAAAAQAVRGCLAGWLASWDDADIATLGGLMARFNTSTGSSPAPGLLSD